MLSYLILPFSRLQHITDFLVPLPSWILQYILLYKVEYYFLNGKGKHSFANDYHILLLV